jgi:hypothetical protein
MGPLTHRPVPGDIPRGLDRPYKGRRLTVTLPTLPVRVPFRNALPSAFVPLPTGAGAPLGLGRAGVYRGVTSPTLGPIIEKRRPWE